MSDTPPNDADLPTKPQLVMFKPTLDDLPELRLPEGYRMRSLAARDDAAWELIISRSFEWEEATGTFAKIMRADHAYRPGRVLFVCRGDDPVATASAWFRPKMGEQTGYLHYVGTRPDEAGKALGLQVSLAALHKMREEGRTKAMLQTDDFRLAAIKTYLKLGFEPRLIDENQRDRWRRVFEALGRRDLIERYEAKLTGPLEPV